MGSDAKHILISIVNYPFVCCRELARIFELDDYMTNLKTEILMDLYFYVIQFARDNNFAKEKTSTLFSIVKRVHEMCIGNCILMHAKGLFF